jgi:hypothetical protein
MKKITYQAGYKYLLMKSVTFFTDVYPSQAIQTPFICLDSDGTLTIKRGYAWDGPSGPTVDTRNFMRGSLAHDSLYQMMREGHLDEERTYWFEGMTITNGFDAEGKAICTLRGPLADQAALHGLLAKIRDMNLSLLSVSQDVPASGDKSQAGKQGEDQV